MLWEICKHENPSTHSRYLNEEGVGGWRGPGCFLALVTVLGGSHWRVLSGEAHTHADFKSPLLLHTEFEEEGHKRKYVESRERGRWLGPR